LSEPTSENDNEFAKSISHFVITSGVINSDKVIVQSEAMRKMYIKILLDHFGDTEENRKIIENKIEGTGSPKFDKILNAKKDDIDIPEEWKKLIIKSDGTMKKVILYNTSIGALLNSGEKMIKKIENTLEVFYLNKDDITLLWRPHPLVKATIESMHPQLWENYKQVVDRYIAEGWGIYDDTSDLNRAIIMSDAYYGDASSLVQLCQKRDLPIMIQSVEV